MAEQAHHGCLRNVAVAGLLTLGVGGAATVVAVNAASNNGTPTTTAPAGQAPGTTAQLPTAPDATVTVPPAPTTPPDTQYTPTQPIQPHTPSTTASPLSVEANAAPDAMRPTMEDVYVFFTNHTGAPHEVTVAYEHCDTAAGANCTPAQFVVGPGTAGGVTADGRAQTSSVPGGAQGFQLVARVLQGGHGRALVTVDSAPTPIELNY